MIPVNYSSMKGRRYTVLQALEFINSHGVLVKVKVLVFHTQNF